MVLRLTGVLPTVLSLAITAFAQGRANEYETFSIMVGGTHNANRTTFHQYWNPGSGIELSVSTPFYVGYLESAGAFHVYRNKLPSVPRFNAISASVGWGIQVPVTRFLDWRAGVRAGNYRMSFDYETFRGVRNESEFSVAVLSQIHLQFTNTWFFYLSGSYEKTFTYIRLKPLYISAGIGHTFKTPRWMQEVLR